MAGIDKVTLSLDSDMLAGARVAAAAAGQSLSAYIAAATRNRLATDGARAVAEFLGTPTGADAVSGMRSAARRRAAAFRDAAA